MSNLTEKEKKEIIRNRESSNKNQSSGFPWGLKVNKKKEIAKKIPHGLNLHKDGKNWWDGEPKGINSDSVVQRTNSGKIRK